MTTLDYSSLPALRPAPIPGLGAALLGAEEEELLLQVIRSRQLFRFSYLLPVAEQGVMSNALEAEFRQRTGAAYALGVTSGTAALEVALGALGVGPGDEVIVAAWSWVSCFTAIVRLGARPVLAEIDETLCLAPGEITRLHSSRTKAVIVVHFQGVVASMDEIMAEARALNLKVLEDCAESAGARYKGRAAGTIGDIGIFSFQYQKMITSGEGGMVVTSDPVLYERAVRFHDLGNVRPFFHQHLQPSQPSFCGGQYRMNELTAATALAQSRKLDRIITRCRELNRRIERQLEALPGICFRRIPDPEGDCGIEIYFFLPTRELSVQFTTALAERNVPCIRMTGTYCHYGREYGRLGLAHTPSASPFGDLGTMPAPGYREEDFPQTEALIGRFVTLPMGVLYTDEDADYIAATTVGIYRQLIG